MLTPASAAQFAALVAVMMLVLEAAIAEAKMFLVIQNKKLLERFLWPFWLKMHLVFSCYVAARADATHIEAPCWRLSHVGEVFTGYLCQIEIKVERCNEVFREGGGSSSTCRLGWQCRPTTAATVDLLAKLASPSTQPHLKDVVEELHEQVPSRSPCWSGERCTVSWIIGQHVGRKAY